MNPFSSALKSAAYLLGGRLKFCRQRAGDEYIDENGQLFRVFRCVKMEPSPGQPENAAAVFIAHFHPADMGGRANILFSLIPMWFIMGLPGFRSKYWLIADKSGDFAGYYEWNSLADAQNYADSFAVRFMTGRSTPGSVRFKVYPAGQAPSPPGKPGPKPA